MCYDDNARPPQPPGEARPARGEDLVLTAADGTRFAAYAAEPQQARPAQVLIYPDIRGLHQFYKELALRFAELSYPALAIDYFGRTAGLTGRDESFDFRPHVEQMQVRNVLADARAALQHLRQGQSEDRATFLLGFCRGGSLGLYSAAEDLDLAGLVAFYAGLARRLDEQKGTPVDVARHARCPVLGLFGADDAGIPPEHVQLLDEALDQAGVEHNLITYPGAPHSFFDRHAAKYAEASADAWQQVLSFISTHTPVHA
jgi:carboxymethylenebutenolidase